jgi:hypothetical protein
MAYGGPAETVGEALDLMTYGGPAETVGEALDMMQQLEPPPDPDEEEAAPLIKDEAEPEALETEPEALETEPDLRKAD